MEADGFDVLDLLPELTVLVTSEGHIVAANRAATLLSGTSRADLIGSVLASHLTDAAEKVDRYLMLCARSRQMVPGSFTWRTGPEVSDLRFDGAVLRPRTQDTTSVILLRGRAKQETVNKFRGLNERIAVLTHEVAERRRSQDAQARLAAIVESSDDAIISENLDGMVTSWNSAAERIFGYSPQEMVGQSILTIIPADRHAEVNDIRATLRAGQRVEHFDTIRMAKGGRSIAVSLSMAPLRDVDGRIVGASKIARDVTERKDAEAEREQLMGSERAARVAAERANRAKDEFLATLSHELRTPLNAMLGWSQLMQTTRMGDDDLAQATAAIERNVRLQAQLVDDLLDMSRIMSGKMHLAIQRVNAASVVQAAIETVRPAANAKGIELDALLDSAAGPVSADPTRLQQVVWNLLSNAVKFTPKGGRVQLMLQLVNSRDGDSGHRHGPRDWSRILAACIRALSPSGVLDDPFARRARYRAGHCQALSGAPRRDRHRNERGRWPRGNVCGVPAGCAVPS